jgi:hypothetical protein
MKFKVITRMNLPIAVATLGCAGAAWGFTDAGPAPYAASRGPLAGTLPVHYSTNYLNFIALNVIWKF